MVHRDLLGNASPKWRLHPRVVVHTKGQTGTNRKHNRSPRDFGEGRGLGALGRLVGGVVF